MPDRIYDGRVLIGKKDKDDYVYSVMCQARKLNTVLVRGRGMSTSKAIDVSLMALRKLPGWKQEFIQIGTEEMLDNDGSSERKSFIEIRLTAA